MPEYPPIAPTLYPPLEVEWRPEERELLIVGTAGLGVDQWMRTGLLLTPAASRELLLCIRRLLETVDADAIDTRPRDLQ
jgi:hypothetical protein